jgi:hypothetical protein
MSIKKKSEGLFEVRWWEGGRNKSVRVHGSFELARKIERKKLSARDENRHLDVKREVNLRMSALIERYWTHYGMKKRSANREKSILDGIRFELGKAFVREVDGDAVARWYENLTTVRDLSLGTAVRHFNVMHHMMKKAATIWSKDTGIDRNPADQVEVKRQTIRGTATYPKTNFGDLSWHWMKRSIAKGRRISTRRFVGSG